MSNTFYVLKDKKYGSYVGREPISFVASVKDARRFSSAETARYECDQNRIKAGTSILTGGLNLVRVTESDGKPTYRVLPEYDLGKPTDRIKYAVAEDSLYLHPAEDSWLMKLDEGALLNTQSEAIQAITKRAVGQNMQFGYPNINIKRVAVEPGKIVYTETVIS